MYVDVLHKTRIKQVSQNGIIWQKWMINLSLLSFEMGQVITIKSQDHEKPKQLKRGITKNDLKYGTTNSDPVRI